MPCPKTQHLMREYFSDELTPPAGEEIERHLARCGDCRAERDALARARGELAGWRAERVPHWDRGLELYRRERRTERRPAFGRWQWAPLAASLAMLCLVLFDVAVVVGEEGVAVSFGAGRLAAFEEEQRARAAAMEARLEARSEAALLAVLEQASALAADNMDGLLAHFERRRLEDLQSIRAGYERLADSDYETIRSLRRLAQYVSHQAPVR